MIVSSNDDVLVKERSGKLEPGERNEAGDGERWRVAELEDLVLDFQGNLRKGRRDGHSGKEVERRRHWLRSCRGWEERRGGGAKAEVELTLSEARASFNSLNVDPLLKTQILFGMDPMATPTLASSSVLQTTPKPKRVVTATNLVSWEGSNPIRARIDPTLSSSFLAFFGWRKLSRSTHQLTYFLVSQM